MAKAKKKPVLQDIPEEFLACRDYGHAWKPYDVRIEKDRLNPRWRVIYRIQVCMRCPTKRTQVLDKDFMVKSYSYSYPENYLLNGHGYITAEDRASIRSMNTQLP